MILTSIKIWANLNQNRFDVWAKLSFHFNEFTSITVIEWKTEAYFSEPSLSKKYQPVKIFGLFCYFNWQNYNHILLWMIKFYK